MASSPRTVLGSGCCTAWERLRPGLWHPGRRLFIGSGMCQGGWAHLRGRSAGLKGHRRGAGPPHKSPGEMAGDPTSRLPAPPETPSACPTPTPPPLSVDGHPSTLPSCALPTSALPSYGSFPHPRPSPGPLSPHLWSGPQCPPPGGAAPERPLLSSLTVLRGALESCPFLLLRLPSTPTQGPQPRPGVRWGQEAGLTAQALVLEPELIGLNIAASLIPSGSSSKPGDPGGAGHLWAVRPGQQAHPTPSRERL